MPGSVVAVIADRPCAGIEAANERGLTTAVIEPDNFGSRQEWSEALRDEVTRHGPDLIVSAGFMRILSPGFVDSFADCLINIHPSLLPAFPGAHAVRDALAAGATETGTTVHFIDHEVDHGPVISQARVEIRPGDTEDSLHQRIKESEHRLLPRMCKDFLEGRVALEDLLTGQT